MADNRSEGPINSNLTELWREIRKDLEDLPPGEGDGGWSLIWSSHPPVNIFTRAQLQSRWIWFHPTDASLCTRASAIFLRAAKARGYGSEDGWLDELRYADFVKFRITGETVNTLLDGTVIHSVGGVLKDPVKHSITLCHLIEAGAAPMPIIGRLPNEAIARIEAATAAFMVNFMPKLECEAPTMQGKPNKQARLLRELVVYHFETAARECMALCASVGEFETALHRGIARFVHFNVGLHRWLGAAMRDELDMGFTFFAEGADPWAGIAPTERDAKWHVGAIIGEALSYAALKLKLTYEALERAAVGGLLKADQPSATELGKESQEKSMPTSSDTPSSPPEIDETLPAPKEPEPEPKAAVPARIYKTKLGENIDSLRLECGWSFDLLAEKTGLNKQLILGHVNEGKGCYPGTLKKYADAFSKALNRIITVADLKR
jgi:hypothetical protein